MSPEKKGKKKEKNSQRVSFSFPKTSQRLRQRVAGRQGLQPRGGEEPATGRGGGQREDEPEEAGRQHLQDHEDRQIDLEMKIHRREEGKTGGESRCFLGGGYVCLGGALKGHQKESHHFGAALKNGHAQVESSAYDLQPQALVCDPASTTVSHFRDAKTSRR